MHSWFLDAGLWLYFPTLHLKILYKDWWVLSSPSYTCECEDRDCDTFRITKTMITKTWVRNGFLTPDFLSNDCFLPFQNHLMQSYLLPYSLSIQSKSLIGSFKGFSKLKWVLIVCSQTWNRQDKHSCCTLYLSTCQVGPRTFCKSYSSLRQIP